MHFPIHIIATLLLVDQTKAAVVASTPQMGWNSWNTFKANINQSVIEQTADLLLSTGLRDAGYNYLIVDDGWQNSSRAPDGRQQANSTRFPSGMAAVGEYLHARGLKFGIYSDNGIEGCSPTSPGSWGYEELDASTYAAWGVDYLKYDNCGAFEAGTHAPAARFRIMANALLNSGRDIFYSLCQWGNQFPWFWADEFSHSYRMSGDIMATFSDRGKDCACNTAYCLNTGYAGCSVMTIIRKMREVSFFQHRGSFADMDMLEIGVANMTLEEQRTHMSFWAALKSPLIVGMDLTKLSNESLGVLRNTDVIDISQDELGKAVAYLPELSTELKTQVWAGPLSGDRAVVLVFNELNSTDMVTVALGAISALAGLSTSSARDIWAGEEVQSGSTNGSWEVSLASHETKVLVFGGTESD